jgi:hypothetical protein
MCTLCCPLAVINALASSAAPADDSQQQEATKDEEPIWLIPFQPSLQPIWLGLILWQGNLQVKAPSRGGVDPRIAARTTRAANGSLVLGQSQDCYGGQAGSSAPGLPACCRPASCPVTCGPPTAARPPEATRHFAC